MSKKCISQVDPFVIQATAQDIWSQLTDGQKDALLVMFQIDRNKTHINIVELYNFAKAWIGKNHHVRRYVLGCTLDRMGAGLDKPRKPGFMLY